MVNGSPGARSLAHRAAGQHANLDDGAQPFYYEVDEGNQLPYIDGIQMTLAENLEVLNLRAIAGEYDLQERHTDIAKLPVFLENQEQGNYSLHLDPGAYGSDATLQINHSYDTDPEIAKWLHNRDFRRALSMGIDRDQLNETFWLAVGSPGSVAPAASVPQSPGEEWRLKWATRDVEQANQLLDEIGLTAKDGEFPVAHTTAANGCAWRSSPSPVRSCRSRASRNRSPSSGRRSASSSTSRSWSGTSA